MSTRISLNHMLSFCLMLVSLSVTAWGQSPTQTKVPEETLKSVRFKDVNLRTGLDTLGTAIGLKVVYDDSISYSEKVTIDLQDVTYKKAMMIILEKQNKRACWIGEKTILVFPDTEENREKYKENKPWSDSDGPEK